MVIDRQGNIYASTAEAREEGAAGRHAGAAAEKNGRPEGGAAGVPITSEPPKEPKPPELPNPQPGQARPDPEGDPDEPRPTANDGASRAATTSAPCRAASGSSRRCWASSCPGRAADARAAARGHRRGPPGPRAAEARSRPQPGPGPTPGPGPRPHDRPAPPGRPRQPTGRADQPPSRKPEGNAVYKIDRDGFVTEIFRQPVLILSMVEHKGRCCSRPAAKG